MYLVCEAVGKRSEKFVRGVICANDYLAHGEGLGRRCAYDIAKRRVNHDLHVYEDEYACVYMRTRKVLFFVVC